MLPRNVNCSSVLNVFNARYLDFVEGVICLVSLYLDFRKDSVSPPHFLIFVVYILKLSGINGSRRYV